VCPGEVKHSAVGTVSKHLPITLFLKPREIDHHSKHLEEFCEQGLRQLWIGSLIAKTDIASIYITKSCDINIILQVTQSALVWIPLNTTRISYQVKRKEEADEQEKSFLI
jgi:hypothetical protein